jgi:CRP-like cAMP-binding protein
MRREGPVRSANELLRALPLRDYARVLKGLEPVPLTFGEVLYEPGSKIRYAYFPTEGIVSLLSMCGPDKAAEVGIVGNEGLVGGSAAVGLAVSEMRAVVQGSGSAMRISAARLQKEFSENTAWHGALFRYTHALMGQVAQTAACNRFHMVDARLARWLLATRDRLRSGAFYLTHHFLSQMLGVRRAGVTVAAGKLERKNLITYSRGNIRILNAPGLEAVACTCYGTVKAIYSRSLSKR